MKITNTKFAHEIIDLLINHYVENEIQITDRNKKRSIPVSNWGYFFFYYISFIKVEK